MMIYFMRFKGIVLYARPLIYCNDITLGNDVGWRDFGHCYTETCTAPK